MKSKKTMKRRGKKAKDLPVKSARQVKGGDAPSERQHYTVKLTNANIS